MCAAARPTAPLRTSTYPASSSTRDCFDSTESLIPAASRSAANSTQSAPAASSPQIDNRVIG